MKTLYPLEHPFITVDLYFIAADNMQAKLTDADADITSLERPLRNKMAQWGDELNEEEIERL
jgi:hypothetical protein